MRTAVAPSGRTIETDREQISLVVTLRTRIWLVRRAGRVHLRRAGRVNLRRGGGRRRGGVGARGRSGWRMRRGRNGQLNDFVVTLRTAARAQNDGDEANVARRARGELKLTADFRRATIVRNCRFATAQWSRFQCARLRLCVHRQGCSTLGPHYQSGIGRTDDCHCVLSVWIVLFWHSR